MKIVVGKTGAIPSRQDPRTITFKSVARQLAATPKFRPPAPMFDTRPRGMRWEILGNDRYGNCTIAGIVRIMMASAHRRGKRLPILEQDVINAYLTMTGGVDEGAMPINALTYMRNVGIRGCKVVAFARVDDGDVREHRSALQSFGSMYVAAALPARLDEDRDRRWELTPLAQRTARDAPRSLGGHAFPLFGYQRGEEFAVPWTDEVVIEAPWAQLYMEERWVFIDNQETDETLLAAMHTQLDALKLS